MKIETVYFDDLDDAIYCVSTWLYLNYPDWFKPYFFKNQFYLLTRIADTFGIELLPVPLKKYKEQRHLYYFDLCLSFSNFQIENELTSAEMCAFLYDFAPDYLDEHGTLPQVLPEPTQVWWVGGNKEGGDFDFLDNMTQESVSHWQGNVDTRKGDIIIMYCLTPRSYIHSIWRATSDGVVDPFFYYYSNIYIGQGQKIPPISIQELKADSHFSQNPLVRKNLQGINGYPLSSADYKWLQQLIAAKGGEMNQLPQLYGHTFQKNENAFTERDVEVQLIEPLLERLGYTSQDWVRQLALHMGRGERNYPDYAFPEDMTPGYERARMLIESKFVIKTHRALEDAFKQVWSYGQRLGASTLVIADKEAIWVYEKRVDAFDRTRYTKFFWSQLQEPDAFRQLETLIGKG